MASLQEVDTRSADNRDRIIELENLIQNIMDNTIPLGWLDINSSGDLTGKYLYGKGTGSRASINDGRGVYGWKSNVSNPTSDNDFEKPLGPSN